MDGGSLELVMIIFSPHWWQLQKEGKLVISTRNLIIRDIYFSWVLVINDLKRKESSCPASFPWSHFLGKSVARKMGKKRPACQDMHLESRSSALVWKLRGCGAGTAAR